VSRHKKRASSVEIMLLMAFVVDAVAANSEADARWVTFLWAVSFLRAVAGAHAEVGGFATIWEEQHHVLVNEADCFSSVGHMRLEALWHEAADFVGGSLDPWFGVWTKFELGALKRGT
jgi:hypothetical protein